MQKFGLLLCVIGALLVHSVVKAQTVLSRYSQSKTTETPTGHKLNLDGVADGTLRVFWLSKILTLVVYDGVRNRDLHLVEMIVPHGLQRELSTLEKALNHSHSRDIAAISPNGKEVLIRVNGDPQNCVWFDMEGKRHPARASDLPSASDHNTFLGELDASRNLYYSGSLNDSFHEDTVLQTIMRRDESLVNWQRVKFPYKARVLSVLLSPKKDRVAWLLQVKPPVTFDDVFQPAMPGHYGDHLAPLRLEIWVSKLDGTDQHEVYYEQPTYRWAEEPRYLHELSWLPDGKRISYTIRDTLYTINVE